MDVCETKSGDWRDDMTLPDCMMHMLKNEIMCDVTLRVGEGRTPIKAHKYMLASRSPVFHTMFEGSMPETGEIAIPDIEENTFNNILVYMYSDKITASSSNLTGLLYASDKYLLTKLKRECEKTLKRTATSNHAARALQTAYKYHMPDLLQESLQHIEVDTKECLLSEHALSLPIECVDMILKSDYLSCSETDLCQYLLKWAKTQCVSQGIESNGQNMQNLVGQTLYQIRFPVVDMDYFSKEIANTELLSRDEVISIYRSQYGIYTSKFTNNKRGGPIEKRKVHTVTRCINHAEVYDDNAERTEALIFQADADIWIKGVKLFPFNYNTGITFKILDSNEEVIVHETGINGTYGYEAHIVMLPKPVRILSAKEYTITTQNYKEGYGMYYGVNCNHSVKASDCDVSITFKNSPMCTGISNVDQGQFAGFTFSV